MTRTFISRLILSIACIGLVIAATLWFRHGTVFLRRPELFSGYLLFGIMLVPSALGLRKKISVLPLGTAAFWTRLHVALGVTLIPLYWLHVGAAWPDGPYEQWLTTLFYFVTASGIVGWAIQARFPRRLTQVGDEIQFERIPQALVDYRTRVEQTLINYQAETGNDTLARHYVDTLSWYFFKPRFLLNHLFGGELHEYWLRGKFRAIHRYLNASEQPYLEQLRGLAISKSNVDFHYTLQGVIKLWLFFHIPAATALMVLVLWHLALVHAYSI